jgi:hypothetical protein
MSFSLSGSTITQTGTDTNLSGLNGVSGCTFESFTDGANTYRRVTFNTGISLTINGDLTINANTDQLVFPHTNNSFLWMTIAGTLKLEDTSTLNGVTESFQKLAVRSMARTNDHFNTNQGVHINNGGELFMNGGGFYCNSHINFLGTNSTLTVQSPSLIRLGTAANGSKNVLRFAGSQGDLDADGLILLESTSGIETADIIKLDNYSPRFCAEGALVYGGANNGQITLNSYNPIGCTIDLAFIGPGSFYTVYGYSDKPLTATVHFDHRSASGGGWVKLRKNLDITVIDESNNPLQGVKAWFTDTNNGNRYNKIQNLTSDIVYTGSSNASGVLSFDVLLANVQVGQNEQTGKFSSARTVDYRTKNNSEDYKMDVFLIAYSKLLNTYTDVDLRGLDVTNSIERVLISDSVLSELSKSTVDAYTDIGTPEKFYDKAKSYLVDNFAGETSTIVSRSGNEINAGSYDVTIDSTASTVFDITGNLITIKASTFTGDMVTTGIITLANGAVFDGIRTDANGTIIPPQPVSITNIVAGSRLQIYNVTTGTEIVNQIVSGTSYSTTYVEGTDYTDGDTVRVRLTYVSGTTAKAEYTANVLDTSNGWSLLADQQDDDVYNTLAIDGSNVANFAADYANDQVDVAVATNFNLSNFYAWWVYNMTTAQGIREFFGGITALDQANFRINTGTLSLYLDNTTSTNLVQLDNRRIFRTDGVYPVLASTTGGGGIDVVWRNTILIAETDTTGLTPEESAKLTSIATDSSLIPGIASKTSLILVK